MEKIEFSETEIAWIMHQLSRYYLFDGIRNVLRLLTSRVKEVEDNGIQRISSNKTLANNK